MTVGERIRKARERAGLMQTELAEKIGVTKQNLYKYETGIVSNVPSDKIEAAARVLGVTPAYLMGWEKESDPAAAECAALFARLDSEDQARILERMETMLEADKYGKKGGSQEERAIS